jgi:spermidine synthase
MSASRTARASSRSKPLHRIAPARPTRIAPVNSAAPAALPAWGAVCFFGSGAAGLLYETVWSKQLSYLLGSSLHAVATVVAAFLAGLALGARLLGVPLARRGRPVRVYAALEIGVAVFGLLSLPLLRSLDPLVGHLYRSLGGEGPGFALVRFLLLFALLLPPAALMGATLPVLVGRFERSAVGPALARLYAVNTFGAVAGSILGGFCLMPWLGLLGTTVVAAIVNLAVAALAFTISRAERGEADAATEAAVIVAPGAPTELLAPGQRLIFTFLFGLSGFAALAFQISWVRLFSLLFGSSVYSFSAVLGIYLLGIAFGSAAIARFMDRVTGLAWFGWLALGLAFTGAVQMQAFSHLPDWVYGLAESAGASWPALFAGEVGLVLVLLLVPCALLGMAFPVAARLLQTNDGGHAAGFAYAVNTAGTIAGSLVAGFFLVPSWGVQGTQLAALLLSFAVGISCVALSWQRRQPRTQELGAALLALFATAGLATLAPSWDPSLMSAGSYRPIQATRIGQAAAILGGDGSTVWNATRREEVLYYREGINGSVLVGTDKSGERWLRVGGKIDASTGDMETQVLVGLLPTALAKPNGRTLIVGLGSGFTAAAVLAAGAGPTEIVEIEPGVVEASRFFHQPGAHPLDDPRVQLVQGDARTHLAHGAGQYDLIVSEPTNPWIAGVNNLFTVDFYRRVRQRLQPDGVFCQWMQLYELSPETFSSMVAAFIEVFPQGQLFAVWRSVDVVLIAVPADRRFGLDRLNNPAARALLSKARLTSPEGLAAYWAGPLSALKPITQDATSNRDDRPFVEYRAPRDLVAVGRSSPIAHADVRKLLPFVEAWPEGPLFSAWSTKSRWYEARTRGLVEQGEEPRAQLAVQGARAAGETELADRLHDELQAESAALAGAIELGQRRPGPAVERAREAQRWNPRLGKAYLLEAQARIDDHDTPGAITALRRGLEAVPADQQISAALTSLERAAR